MKKVLSLMLAASTLLSLSSCGGKAAAETADSVTDSAEIPVVYYIRDITPENLVKIYEALGRPAEGNNVGVKISTGESNKSNHLSPALIEPLVKKVNGTLIECNTAYNGNRMSTEDHLRAAEEHGYTAIARVDIMDAEGDTILPVDSARHITHDIVGRHFLDYDFLVVLSHFKGHAMGGFGGALKNVAIGIASTAGKTNIHTAGKTDNASELWGNLPEQDDFLESMAEACQAVFKHTGDKVLFINVANNLSVDCDCDANPDAPQMGDLGILASLDPVALDRACVDMVYNSTDSGKVHLIERIESRHGTHILDYGEQIGLGSQKYRLVEIK
ncbi:MAG: DUF362 domain-containing protein [Muribaculaceae bacterium]|nr:DUF362 domain-containing protein [Muribaculaceae bacterium]